MFENAFSKVCESLHLQTKTSAPTVTASNRTFLCTCRKRRRPTPNTRCNISTRTVLRNNSRCNISTRPVLRNNPPRTVLD